MLPLQSQSRGGLGLGDLKGFITTPLAETRVIREEIYLFTKLSKTRWPIVLIRMSLNANYMYFDNVKSKNKKKIPDQDFIRLIS